MERLELKLKENGYNECPICHDYYTGEGAVSRYHEFDICDSCGIEESFQKSEPIELSSNSIIVLVKNVGEDIKFKRINHSLESFQSIIEDSYLEFVRGNENSPFLICDEEGLLKDKPLNAIFENYGKIVGNAFFCRADEYGNEISVQYDDIEYVRIIE